MRAKATGSLLAAAIVVGAVLAASVPPEAVAGPEPRMEHLRREVVESFAVRGSNGFTIDVTLKNRHRLRLGASQSRGIFNVYGTGYQLRAPQTHGSDDIDARVGRLGRIDVRFVPESVSKEPPAARCHGPRLIVEEGRYVGTIVFHGEGGYTSVRATNAEGSITRTPPLTCKPLTLSRRLQAGDQALKRATRAKNGGENEPIAAELRAKVKGRPIRFKASILTELKPSGKLVEPLISFLAEAHRRRGRIKEASVAASIFLPAKTFRLPEPEHPNREAILAPPAPFQGTGTFRHGSNHAVSWTGDLRVELPGFGEVHLAGPGTRARYCGASDCHWSGGS